MLIIKNIRKKRVCLSLGLKNNMKKILTGLLIIILLIIGGLSYLGVVPFISPLITKPKDLGIKADPALVVAFDEKMR